MFIFWFRCTLSKDEGFSEWAEYSCFHLCTYRIVFLLTLLAFPFFRLIYCRLNQRLSFSAFFLDGPRFLSVSKCYSFLVILCCISPMVFVGFYIVVVKI